jgi:hypothetical protein
MKKSMFLVVALIANIGTMESFRTHLAHLPSLVRLAIAMAAVLLMPSLSRRLKLPSIVGEELEPAGTTSSKIHFKENNP